MNINGTDEAHALAEVWASICGNLDEFLACKSNIELEGKLGHYEGYMAEAEEMIKRLATRGFYIVPSQPKTE